MTVNDVTHSSASLRPCVITPTMLCVIPVSICMYCPESAIFDTHPSGDLVQKVGFRV